MSDQAIFWKFAFGVLVLLLSGVAFLMRKDSEPTAALRSAVPMQSTPSRPVAPPAPPAPPVAPAATPAEPSEAPALQEPAPADLPEAQEAPVRIRISLHEPKAHRSAPHMSRVNVHGLRAMHERRHRRLHASPYVAGRTHYPFDPRDRWRQREG